MKKALKCLLLTLLVAAMMLNTCGIVIAANATTTFDVTEAVVDEATGVRKLVFSIAPSSTISFMTADVVFSYDNAVVQPVNPTTYEALSVATGGGAAVKDDVKPGTGFTMTGVKYQVNTARTGVRMASMSFPAASVTPDESRVLFEFFFKIKTGKSANSETFMLETDYSDGSILKALCPQATTAGTVQLDSVKYGTPSTTDSEAIASATVSYEGDDILVLDTIEVAAGKTKVVVPTVYNAQGATNAAAEVVTLTATAKSTIWTEGAPDMPVPAGAVWTIEAAANDPKVKISGTGATATLTVEPGALDQDITVKVEAEGKEDTVVIDVVREAGAPAATYMVAKADGVVIAPNSKITVVKPATESSPATTVNFTATVYDQYGLDQNVAATAVEFKVSEADLAEGISIENNVLTVTNAAGEVNINMEAVYGDLSVPFSADIVGLVVDWTPVTVETEGLVYGVKNGEIVSFTTAEGTATVPPSTTVTGKFSVDNADVAQDADTDVVVTVRFTADDTEANGVYAKTEITRDYIVSIAKAEQVIDAQEVTTVKYDGTAKSVTATTSGDGAITYAPAQSYTDAGTYEITVSAAETTNYYAATKTITLVIEKADIDMTGVTFTSDSKEYTGEALGLEIAGTLSDKLTVSYAYPGTATGEAVTVGTYAAEAIFEVKTEYADNYNTPAKMTAELEIVKATATSFETAAPAYTDSARNFAESERTLATVKADIESACPTATVNFGENRTKEVAMTWADATETLDAKGGRYTYIGTPSDDNLEFGDLTLTATIEVEAVTGTLAAPLNDILIKYTRFEDSIVSHVDLDFPGTVTINVTDGEALVYTGEALTWDVTLEELMALEVGENVDVTMTSVLPEWLTIDEDLTLNFGVIDKEPATVTVEQAGKTYGDVLPAAVVSATFGEETITTDAADFVFEYEGINGTDYAKSTTVPTQAGEYKVTATLDNADYAGTASDTFTIAPKAITYKIANAEKDYSDANPDFTGALDSEIADNTLAEGDEIADLNIVLSTEADATTPVGTAAITGTWDNANYNVTFVDGVLTINRKALDDTDKTLAITGTAAVGSELIATIDLADEELTFQWMVAGVDVEGATAKTYTPAIKDSNKAIAVKVTAVANYQGELTAEAVTVAKYEITGSISIIIDTDNGSDNTINAGDVLAVDTTGIVGYAELVAAGFVPNYIWKIDGVEVATGATYPVEASEGDLTVEIAAGEEGDFVGSIASGVAEIGKTPVTGSIEIAEADGIVSITSNTVSGVEGVDYDLVWKIGDVDITEAVVEGAYTIVAGDYGKTITVTVVLREDGSLTGNVAPATEVVDPIAPSDVVIAATATTTSITAKFTATANGAEITKFQVKLGDAETWTDVTAVEGEFTYTFSELTAGTAYTISAKAINEAGESEVKTETVTTSTPSRPRPSTPTTTPSTPSAPSTGTTVKPDADGNVKVEDTSASVNTGDLKDAEEVNVSTETESGVEITTTVNVADANVEKLEVSTKDSDKTAAGAAAEGVVGKPVEVKVEAKDEKGNAVEVTVDVAIPSEEEAYAYIIDENGVATRTESVYNEETGTVEIANVPDGAVVVLSTTAPATFDDAVDHWAEDTINYAADAGIMNGVGGSTFNPDGNATRGMVNAMLVRLAEVAGIEIKEAADQKVDTDAEHWAAATDLIALANGWTKGIGTLEDGTVVIDTDATVTREQLVTMLWRFLANPEAEGSIESFDDHAETSEWAKDAKAWAVGAGIINGKPGNILDPTGTATRAEIATMFGRLMNYMTK